MNPRLLLSVITDPVVWLSATGILLLDMLLVTALVIFILRKTGLFDYRNSEYLSKVKKLVEDRYREFALTVSLSATSGSLYFSEILGWTPCKLCWLQRIFIYPLPVLLLTSLVLDKRDVQDYVLPLSLIGLAIAIYHYPVQLTAMTSSGCSAVATSCDMTYTRMYGYITVPMMAITSLSTVIYLMLLGDDDLM